MKPRTSRRCRQNPSSSTPIHGSHKLHASQILPRHAPSKQPPSSLPPFLLKNYMAVKFD